MTIDELKYKVASVTEEIGVYVPYETDQIEADDFESLSIELAELASHLARDANRVAAYSAIASRLAK